MHNSSGKDGEGGSGSGSGGVGVGKRRHLQRRLASDASCNEKEAREKHDEQTVQRPHAIRTLAAAMQVRLENTCDACNGSTDTDYDAPYPSKSQPTTSRTNARQMSLAAGVRIAASIVRYMHRINNAFCSLCVEARTHQTRSTDRQLYVKSTRTLGECVRL